MTLVKHTRYGPNINVKLDVPVTTEYPQSTQDSQYLPTFIPNITDSSRRLYLFPVTFWEGGPNWNYKSFRLLLIYAIHHNRTIVTIPFHNHHIQGWYLGWRSFQETFDLGSLRKIVSIVTPEEYGRQCNNTIDLLLQFPFSTMKQKYNFYRSQYERTRNDFMDLWNISLPSLRNNPHTVEESTSRIQSANDTVCLGIHDPLEIPQIRSIEDVTNEASLSVDKHLKRAPDIRNLGTQIKNVLFGNKTYAALHWRNKTGEICEFNMSLPHITDCSERLFLLSKLSDKIDNNIKKYMMKHRIECIYIATPPRDQVLIHKLKKRISCLATAKDIYRINNGEYEKMETDNYRLSLVEQEICEGSDLFLACSRSNWSDMVRYSRDVLHKLTIELRQLVPDLPKTIYGVI
ncbi:uncharacterized protein LOC144359581 [Saccoglossus kowalevskii]